MNNCVFIGNLGKDPVIKYWDNSDPSCTFSLAVAGRKKDETVWVNVTVWGKLAENCAQYLSKGKKAAVVGSVEVRTWESNGKHGASLECAARSVEFLSSLSESDIAF